MNKKLTLIAWLALAVAIRVYSQDYEWAISLGSNEGEFGASVAVDASGGTFVSGTFKGTADFDPSVATANLTAVGEDDIFLAKYDADGNFVWVKQIGSTEGEVARNVSLDASGNVYMTGNFKGTVDFDPSSATDNLTAEGLSDIFLAKYDNDGNYIWAKQLGGTDNDVAFSVAIDASGNSFIAGYFYGTADFDPSISTQNLSSTANSQDIFLAKYDTNGDYVWAHAIGGANNEYALDLDLDATGSVYITGAFGGSIDFDPSSNQALVSSTGFWDIFVAKYDPNGAYVWATESGSSNGSEFGHSIAVDDSGQSYVTGYKTLTNEIIVLNKFDASGSPVWSKELGGNRADRGNGVAVDASGYVYITGFFEGTADFDPSDPSPSNVLTSAGIDQLKDIFLAKYAANGDFQFAEKMGGAFPDEASRNGFFVDDSGNAYIIGTFGGTADFDPSGTAANLTSTGGNDIFVAKYSTPSTLNIPDANFKTYLVGNAAINTNGDSEIQVTEAQAYSGNMICSFRNISDLTGIEAFPGLTALYCNNNQLTSLDVSQNPVLAELYCNDNQLTSLNVANGNNTNFTNFDATNNPNLTTCIQVDDATFSTSNWTDIDAVASFCSNTAPVLDAVGDKSVDEGSELTFTATATDTYALSYSLDATSEEKGMSIGKNSGVFTWIPTRDNVGANTVTISVSDGPLEDNETITITVNSVNQDPTDIELDVTSIDENNSVGAFAQITTTDPDAADLNTHTYALSGTDAASFEVIDDGGSFSLGATEVFDFEIKSSYEITITTSDPNGGSLNKDFIIAINNVNEGVSLVSAISDLNVADDFSEDIDLDGVFEDADGDVLSYSATSSNENAVGVSLSGATLTVFDNDIRNLGDVTITVTASDGNGLSADDEFTVSLTNEEPTGISLNNSAIGSNLPVGSLVGFMTTDDPDAGDTHTYSLSGTDAASFSIDGDRLLSAEIFDASVKSSYDITITTTDAQSLSFDKSFTITIEDVDFNQGLRGLYTFNSGSLRNVSQEQFAAPDGVAVGNPTATTDRRGASDRALQISTDNFARINSNVVGDGVFMINGWFKLDSDITDGIQVVLDSRQNAQGGEEGGFTIALDAEEKISVNFWINPGPSFFQNVLSMTSEESINIGEWYMFTLTRTTTNSNRRIGFYLNGKETLVGDLEQVQSVPPYDPGTIFTIGAQGTGIRALDGAVDDLYFTTLWDITRIHALLTRPELNASPTDIQLSDTTIAEKNSIGDVIATLTTSDLDDNDTHTYSLGGTDAASFQINGDELVANEVFNFQVKDTYEITLTSDDGNGGTFNKDFTIHIENEPDLLSKYTFDNTLSDSLGLSNAEAVGSPTYATDRKGNASAAIDITSGNYARNTDQIINLEKDFSINLWARPDQTTVATSQYLVSSRQDNDDREAGGLAIILNTDRNLSVASWDRNVAGAEVFNVNNFQTLPVNQWQMITVTKNSDSVSIYHQGVLVNTTSLTGSELFDNGLRWNFGAVGSGRQQFDGQLDDITFYDYALAQSEIDQLYDVTNFAPTDLFFIDADPDFQVNIDEFNEIGDSIASIGVTDPDPDDTHVFAVSGTGAEDFTIEGNTLKANRVFDNNEVSIYTLTITATDAAGLSYSETVNVVINDIEILGPNEEIASFSFTDSSLVDEINGFIAEATEFGGSNFNEPLLPESTTDRFNEENKALLFSLDRSLTVPESLISFEDDFSINFWFRMDGDIASPGQFLLNGGGLTVGVNELEQLVIQGSNANNAVFSESLPDPLTPLQWYMVTISVNTTSNPSLNVYLNGALELSGTLPTLTAPEGWFIGSAGGQFEFLGKMDDIVFYRKGLSAAEVSDLYDVEENLAPTEITLSSNTIDENSPIGTVIGTFTTTDPNAGDTHTYSLLGGDAASFSIQNENELVAEEVFDFEAQEFYSFNVTTTDQGGLSKTSTFTVTVVDVAENSAPTDIILSATSLNENESSGTVVGLLSTTDADETDSHSYTLSGIDAASFRVGVPESSETGVLALLSNTVFDFETKSSYTIEITTDDGNGGTFTKTFTIDVTDQNDEPTDIRLTGNSIDENLEAGTFIGYFTTVDQDTQDNHTIVIAEDLDAASFTVGLEFVEGPGNVYVLRSAEAFDFEMKEIYVISVRSTDSGGLSISENFTIDILDQEFESNDPTDIVLSNQTVTENQPVGTLVGTISTVDPDEGDTHTYTLGGDQGSSFSLDGNNLLTAEVFDLTDRTTYEIEITADDGNGGRLTKSFIITVLEETVLSLEEGDLQIYPNPASSILFIRNPSKTPIQTEILSLNGRVIFTESEKNEIDISGLADGTYLLRYTIDGKTYVTRFLKK